MFNLLKINIYYEKENYLCYINWKVEENEAEHKNIIII